MLVPWSNRKIFRFLTVVNGSTVCVRARARACGTGSMHTCTSLYDQALARTRKRGMDRRQEVGRKAVGGRGLQERLERMKAEGKEGGREVQGEKDEPELGKGRDEVK